jgi:hypothetical protein
VLACFFSENNHFINFKRLHFFLIKPHLRKKNRQVLKIVLVIVILNWKITVWIKSHWFLNPLCVFIVNFFSVTVAASFFIILVGLKIWNLPI